MLFLNRGNWLLAGRRICKDWHQERILVSLCNIMNLSPKNYLYRLENLVWIVFDFDGNLCVCSKSFNDPNSGHPDHQISGSISGKPFGEVYGRKVPPPP